MNTINFSFPIPEPLKPYFKKEFLYLLNSYSAHDNLFHFGCKNISKDVDAIGWSLDRHLVWFMSHFSVEPADYEFSYIDKLISQPGWQTLFEDHWEEWLDKLVAPSDNDIDDCVDADEVEDE